MITPATARRTAPSHRKARLGSDVGVDFRALQFRELGTEVRGDRAHAVDACLVLGGAVVVRVPVHVVGVEIAACVANEFDAGDPYPVVVDEAPIALDDR